ncbi:acyl-protein thioesterase [Hypoxylon sp. NC0597]|nr:acyl-protein thioesterase [Hypoxylon sp. NC0597]
MSFENSAQSGYSSLYIVEPTSPHTYSFILLHGLGSNGRKFGQELLESGICSDGKKLPELFPGARFIFPTAKRRRSSAFSRAKLTQWFNIASLEEPHHQENIQLKGLAESAQEIFSLIQEESRKVSRESIILGGLSQGCAMSICCLLACDFPIGGFIGMSGWLPFQPEIESLASCEDETLDSNNPFDSVDDDPFASTDGQTQVDDNPIVSVIKFYRNLLCLDDIENPSKDTSSLSTPVFLGHGDADEKVKVSLGEAAHRTLELIGYNVSWKAYGGQGHWYKIPDEINDIVKFIQERVGWNSGNS